MIKKIVLCVCCFFAAFSVQANSLHTEVEPEQINLGEMLQLKIIYEGDEQGNFQPDLSVLQNNYDIRSTSSSIASSYINGKVTQKRQWLIGLLPHNDGKQVIPSIKVGKYETLPMDVEVLPTGSVLNLDADDEIEFDNSDQAKSVKSSPVSLSFDVEEKQVYVQQQLNAVLTIHDSKGINIEQEPIFSDDDNWVIKNLNQPVIEEKDGERIIKFSYKIYF